MKHTLQIIEPKGWPEFSGDDWKRVRGWMHDRRIPNLRAFYAYVGRREQVFDAMVAALKREPR